MTAGQKRGQHVVGDAVDVVVIGVVGQAAAPRARADAEDGAPALIRQVDHIGARAGIRGRGDIRDHDLGILDDEQVGVGVHSLRGHQHGRRPGRTERRVVPVDLVSGRAAQVQAVIADDLGVRDAVEDPAVAGVEARGGPPVPRRPVVRIRLSAESDAGQRVRRPARYRHSPPCSPVVWCLSSPGGDVHARVPLMPRRTSAR